MNKTILTRCAFGAAAVLAGGCSGSQSPAGALGAPPQATVLARPADAGKSWMLPEAKREALLYVGGGWTKHGYLHAYTYPQGKLVGKITGLVAPMGACADSAGNIWVVTNQPPEAIEYAHGGTTPISTLSVPANAYAFGCAVDPTTGNLAVTSNSGISIFPDGQGTPTTYTDWAEPIYCSYDNKGNLFVNTSDELTELPLGSSSFIIMNFSKNQTALRNVQWDGKYLVVGGAAQPGKRGTPEPVYEVSVSGSEGTVIKTIDLSVHHEKPDSAEFWIEGSAIAQPVDRGAKVALWAYPAGGMPTMLITNFGPQKYDTLAVTVSRAR